MAMPFFKIMANVVKFGIDNTALGMLTKRAQSQWSEFVEGAIDSAGNAVRKSEEQIFRDRASLMTRMVTGTGTLAALATLHHLGVVTGAHPKDQRQALINDGVPEYSMRIGDKWYSYSNVDPLTTIMALGANISMAYDVSKASNNPEDETKLEEAITAWALAFTDPLISKNWSQSIQMMYNLVMRPEEMTGKKFRINFAESFLPLSGQIDDIHKYLGDSDQNILREVREWSDLYWKKVDPTKQNIKHHALYGTPLKYESPLLMGLVRVTKANTEDKALNFLTKVGLSPEPMPRKIKGIDLTEDQYNELNDILAKLPESAGADGAILDQLLAYKKDTGTLGMSLHDALVSVVDTDIPDYAKSQECARIIQMYRGMAKDVFMSRHKEFMIDPVMEEVDKLTGKADGRKPSTRRYRWFKEITKDKVER
jgi:hypothetical protein